MEISSRTILLLSAGLCFSGLSAQETATKWDVEIPELIADGAPSPPAPKPDPIEFRVLSSRTTRMDVTKAPEIPDMPDLADGGPSFVVVEGDEESPAMDTLEQLHDLYRKEGARMEEAYHARVKARAVRKAYLLANPPVPEDVLIRVWKRDLPTTKSRRESAP
jgi:hypothetical protein